MSTLRALLSLTLGLMLLPAASGAYTINSGPGGELYWDQAQVFRESDGRIPYWIQYEGTDDLSFVHRDVLRQGFLAWAEVEGADLHFFEQRIDLREAEFHSTDEDEADKKALLFYIEEDWPYDDLTIGLTLVTFNGDGRIIDADIGFNGEDYAFSMNDEPADVDLLSVATHEIGHFLGIGHSEFEDATMFATYPGGIEARTLSDDDRAAVEYLYPCEETCRSIVDWRPRASRTGCATGGGGWGALAVLGALLVIGARRRSVVAALVCVTALTAPAFVPEAESTFVERVGMDGLAERADRVVRATVRSVEAVERGYVYSRITLDVTEDLAGAGEGTVVIEQPGGVLDAPAPSGVYGTVALGFPTFAAGEDVVVFLAEDGDVARVVGLAQGKLSVDPTGTLARDLSGLALTAIPGRTPVAVDLPADVDGLRAALDSRVEALEDRTVQGPCD